MITKIRFIIFIFLVSLSQFAFTQNKKEVALTKAIEAINMMDNGKIDESIVLLKECLELDPKNFTYSYEMAYAYYIKEDYKESIRILESIMNHKDVTDQLFQLLGNAYDVINESNKALEVYDKGLKKFPKSGRLYLEKGNVFWGKQKYEEALPFYEKGIEIDPSFPSNYYRATLIYCGSSESVWGIIYGEIFMNLERNSKRTREISKLLYSTYKKNITISEEKTKIEFCDVIIRAENVINKNEIKLPFCAIFGKVFILSTINIKSVNQNTLDKIRTTFIENYFQMEYHKTYPNELYNYQKKIIDAGHFEAYNHWILMKGDEDEFDLWYSENKDKYEKFINWFTDHKLELNDEKKFYKNQY